MSNEQKLREVVIDLKQKVIELCRLCNCPLPDWSLEQADKALATTEPEPTGMPELPEPVANVSASSPVGGIGFVKPDKSYFTEDQTRAYGEQCWKAGYKHGAWADKPEPTSKQSLQVEPAVNQQLTTEPFDEREAFEHEMSCEEIWGHRSFKKKPDGRYANWCVDLMWDVWQARAAMTQGVKG